MNNATLHDGGGIGRARRCRGPLVP
jgi:hypothetical protein